MIDRRQFILTGSTWTAATALGLSMADTALAKTLRGVSYGPKKLDIYSPAGKSGRPVILFAHGGAWALGNRGQVGRKPKFFTDNNMVFASLSYTLYPAANAITQARQVSKAVQFMRNNAERFGGDPERIILMGHSAGCHLATLSTLAFGNNGLRGIVCNDTGAYDLAYLAKVSGGSLPLIYKAPFRKRSKWQEYSPISYAANHNQLPMMVIWSGGRNRDRITANFINRLRQNNADVTPFNGMSYSHMTVNSSIGKRGQRINNALLDFVQDALSRNDCQEPSIDDTTANPSTNNPALCKT